MRKLDVRLHLSPQQHNRFSAKNLAVKISLQAEPIIDRDRVDPTLAAAALFLAAEQYADANEAARRIRVAEG